MITSLGLINFLKGCIGANDASSPQNGTRHTDCEIEDFSALLYPPIINPPLNPEQIIPAELDLQYLLRTDASSAGTPVPTLSGNEYFFVPNHAPVLGETEKVYSLKGEELGYLMPAVVSMRYDTPSHILDNDGKVIGYRNSFELFNQTGEKIAKIREREVIREGEIIGYFTGPYLYDLHDEKIGVAQPGDGKILQVEGEKKKIIANTADDWSKSANNFFFQEGNGLPPILTAEKIKELKIIAENFRPDTEQGKLFRNRLFSQLNLIIKIRDRFKHNPALALSENNDPLTKAVGIWLLAESKISDDKILSIITEATKDKDRHVRCTAILALGWLKNGVETILPFLNNDDGLIEESALKALEEIAKDPDLRWLVNKQIFSAFFENRRFLRKALETLQKTCPELRERLIEKVRDEGSPVSVRTRAILALLEIKAREIEALVPDFMSFPPEVRAEITSAVCKIVPEKIIELSEKALFDPDPLVREAFVDGLYLSKEARAEPMALYIFANDPSDKVREAAIYTLSSIGGQKTLNFLECILKQLSSKDIAESEKERIASKYAVAIRILASIKDKRFLAFSEAFINLPYSVIHKKSAEALSIITSFNGGPELIPFLSALRKKKLDKIEKREIARQYSGFLLSIDYDKDKRAYQKFIPELRELLKDEDWVLRKVAAITLVRLGDNILPLLDKIEPALINNETLAAIGFQIGEEKNQELFDEILRNVFAPKDSNTFKRNTYMLLAAIEEWKEKQSNLSDIQGIYLKRLTDPNADIPTKRLSVNFLCQLLKIEKSTVEADLVATALLEIKGPFEVYILRNLATVKDVLSIKLKQTVEDKIKSMLISTSPPYTDWFNKNKNPNNLIVAKVYFQIEKSVWEELMVKDGFKRIDANSKEAVMEKKTSGITLRVVMVDILDEKGKLRTNIFQDLANPEIHYIAYNGHAGMGGNIEMRELSKEDSPTGFGTKIIQIGACSSMYSYYPRVLKLYPNSQFIGNVELSYSEDDAKVFLGIINGIALKKNWDEINVDIKKKAPFVYHYQIGKPTTFFNHLLPNSMDQFKYAILNELEASRGAETLDFAAPRQELSDINSQYGGRLRQAVNNLNVSLSYQSFFENAEITTGNNVYDGIYFTGPTDEPKPLKIEQISNHNRPVFKIEINAGYSHLSINALSILLLYEINSHFSNKKHGTLSSEDKLRGLLMAAEYIHYHYQRREVEGLQIFELFKQRYGFSEISFEEVYRLQEALDNNLPQKEELKTRLLAKIN